MIAGVRRGEARGLWTIIHEHSDLIFQGKIIAGTITKDDCLHQAAANKITDNPGHTEREYPRPSAPPKIDEYEDEEKEVKRYPYLRLAQEGKNVVEKTICPPLIDNCKKPMIKIQNVLKKSRMSAILKQDHDYQ